MLRNVSLIPKVSATPRRFTESPMTTVEETSYLVEDKQLLKPRVRDGGSNQLSEGEKSDL